MNRRNWLASVTFSSTWSLKAPSVDRLKKSTARLDHLGAQSNAFTSEESTVFHACVLPECQDQAVDLLTDIMRPSLREEDFQTERQVVLEEIAMYDDQPPYGALERAMELFFGEHSLGRRVLGTAETVGEMTIDQMCNTTNNVTRWITWYWWPVVKSISNVWLSKRNRSLVVGEAVPSNARRVCLSSALITRSSNDKLPISSTRSKSGRVWVATIHRDTPLRLLSSVIADESGSRLFWELIDTGLAETAALWPQFFQECGCIVGYLCCAPEDTEENVEIIERVFQEVIDHGVTDRELDLARNKMVSSLILSDERPSNRLFALGQSWLARKRYDPLDAILARYAAVTPADLREMAIQTLAKLPQRCRLFM